MDNFRAFNFEEIKLRLEAFAPGMAQAITPIKYEAITPDLFGFLFRTTGKDNKDYYFVLFNYDYIPNFDEAVAIIESWHGAKVQSFWEPIEGQKHVESDNEQIHRFAADYEDTYHSLLAIVDRPAGTGYWATNIVVLPGDDIDDKLAHLPEVDKKAAKKALSSLLNTSRKDTGESIVDTLKAKQQAIDPESLKTNNTDLAISLFKNRTGGWEFFYNPVRRKPK